MGNHRHCHPTSSEQQDHDGRPDYDGPDQFELAFEVRSAHSLCQAHGRGRLSVHEGDEEMDERQPECSNQQTHPAKHAIPTHPPEIGAEPEERGGRRLLAEEGQRDRGDEHPPVAANERLHHHGHDWKEEQVGAQELSPLSISYSGGWRR